MKKALLFPAIIILSLFISGCGSTNILDTINDVLETSQTGTPTQNEINLGLKEALNLGIVKGVNVVSKTDGYFKNPSIKIPWPADVRKVENTLRDIGLGSEVDKVVMSLNRAAEDAAVAAKDIFIGAIKQLTFTDVMNILKGNDNAATEFLRRTTSSQLTNSFHPKIKASLSKVNATKYWGDIVGKYNQIPLVNKVNPDLTGYVTEKALDGLFTMVAKEEKLIREEPLKRTTDLLKRVFALQD